MNEVKEKAIRIAMGTFLSSWEGDAIDAYKSLNEDETTYISDVEYVEAWCLMEDLTVDDILSNIDCLINDIVSSFS
jgi:hypothetical protein